MEGTISTSQLTSSKPYYRATYWQPPTQMLPQGYLPYSHLQYKPDQKTNIRMQIKVHILLAMGQDCFSKKYMGELLYQQVHVVTKIQELRHSTRNFVWVTGD